MIETPSAQKTSVTLILCLKWPLNYLLPVFPSIPHTANEREKIILSNPQFQRKTEIIEIFVLFIFLWCFTAIPSFWFMVNDATNIGHLEKYHLTKKIQEYYSNFNKETVGVDYYLAGFWTCSEVSGLKRLEKLVSPVKRNA